MLGGTGPTGIALIQESLLRGNFVVIFARSPEKLPNDIVFHASVKIVKGSLASEEDISKAFEVDGGIQVVLSALGPPVTGIHQRGAPIARGYEKVIEVAKRWNVRRFIILGTASIRDPNDKFDVRFKLLILGIGTFAPYAYEDIVEIGHVFERVGEELDWTIARVPVLSSEANKEYKAGYIGSVGTVLSRAAFANFVLDEVEHGAWIRKRPLVSQGGKSWFSHI